MKFFLKSLLLVGFLVPNAVYADILFIDLNHNPKEIEAAQQAAEIRKEKLIVIPQSTAEQKRLSDIYRVANEKVGSLCMTIGRDAKACDKATSEAQKASDSLKKIQKVFTKDELESSLAALKKNGTSLSSLVISGHDGNGEFAGSNGSFRDSDIAEAFANQAPLGDSIRSMMLWGCYTANLGSLTQNWKQTLPNVEMVAGFDASAPLGDKPANWKYLKDALVKEKSLTAIKDANELKNALKGIDGAKSLNAAICVGENVATNKMAINLRDAQNTCKTMAPESQALYECYLNASEKRCANPPANTGSGELRTLYNKLQDLRHCDEMAGGEENPDRPSADTLIRLIYFNNVKENVKENSKDLINRYNDLLKQVGAPGDLQWGDLSKMSRAEVLAKLNKSRTYLDGRMDLKDSFNPELLSLSYGLSSMQEMLGDLRVPFGWVEPHGRGTAEAIAEGSEGMKDANIKESRVTFESNRANFDIDGQIANILSKVPEYQSLKEQDAKVLELVQGESSKDVAAGVKLANEISAKKAVILKSHWADVESGLKAFSQYASESSYPNAEGKKIYLRSLQESIESRAKEMLK